MASKDIPESGRRTEQVADNIFRIPVVLPDNPLKELNSYLIKDSERSLLIDTGFRLPACREALLAGLNELGEKPGDVDIYLTHLHADHSGLSSEIIGDGRRIMINQKDFLRLERLPLDGEKWGDEKWVWSKERDSLAGMPADLVDGMEKLNPAIKYAPPGGVSYTIVEEGDILNTGGYSLRCVSTPGHSPGHMCLWDENSGIMFTGDHVLFDITPNITAWPTVEDSLGDYLDSLRKVRDYPVKKALPGHRKTGDFQTRIDELFRHHEVRLAEVESIVRTEPGLVAYDIAGRMRWKIRAVNWDVFPVSQKFFAVGECLSHLDYLRLRGLIVRELDGGVYRYYGITAT